MTEGNQRQESGPGTGWYWFGISLVLIGLVGGGAMVYFGLKGTVNQGFSAEHVKIPGTHEITLDEKGDYTIFHEYESELDGEEIHSRQVDLADFDLVLYPKGEPDRPVDLASEDGNTTYDFGNRKGRSAYSFSIDQPGTYVLDARRTGDENDGSEAVLAITQFNVFGLMKNVGMAGGGGCLLLLFFLGGLTVLIVTFFSRT